MILISSFVVEGFGGKIGCDCSYIGDQSMECFTFITFNTPCILQKERKQFKLSQKRMASFATFSYKLRFGSTCLVLNCGSMLISDPGHRRQSLAMAQKN